MDPLATVVSGPVYLAKTNPKDASQVIKGVILKIMEVNIKLKKSHGKNYFVTESQKGFVQYYTEHERHLLIRCMDTV